MIKKKRSIGEPEEISSEKEKPAKKKVKYISEQPTTEELVNLRESQNLFQSNLLRLEFEELLNEVRIKDKHKSLIENWFTIFEGFLKSLNDSCKIDLSNLNVKIPMSKIFNNFVGEFEFFRPKNVQIIGSYLSDTSVGPNFTVDIMVEMPEKQLIRSDYKNYKYMKKKAMYLAYIASKIKPEIAESKFFSGNEMLPVLKIIPSGKAGKKFTVSVHVVMSQNFFEEAKLNPGRSNLKTGENTIPTPEYNSFLMRDQLMLRNNVQSAKTLKEYSNVRDAIILLKVWLKQRGLQGNFGYIISMYVLYLLHKNKIRALMSSYQVVRNVWLNLIECNFELESFVSFVEDKKSKIHAEDYAKYFDCIFMDYTGYCNITANISKTTIKWISLQADLAIKSIDNTEVNGFDLLFIKKIPIYQSFDTIISLNAIKVEEDKLLRQTMEILAKGLDKRVSMICLLPPETIEWKIDEEPAKCNKNFIGLNIDPEFAYDILTRGPGLMTTESAEFQTFWGPKAELRRFKDGTMCDVVEWNKGKDILEQIVKYLLKKAGLLEKVHFYYIANQLTNFCLHSTRRKEACYRVINVFDDLRKLVTSLKDLPLEIYELKGISPVLRCTEVFPPLPARFEIDGKSILTKNRHAILNKDLVSEVPFLVAPIEATIQLSFSGKWPNDLEALKKTKTAFYSQIAECLRKQHKLLVYGGYEFVQIYKDGFVFRLSIVQNKELGLGKEELSKELFHLPEISGALHGLHCKYPTFGTVCSLVKRWMSSQLIDDYLFPDLVVDMLVATIYLTPEPFKVPQTPQVGFLRFLEFLAGDITVNAHILNFNDTLTKQELIEIRNFFEKNRETLPPIFISTLYDKQTSMWTNKAPNYLVINRVNSLAKEALRLINTKNFFENKKFYSVLFKASLDNYDLILELEPKMNARRLQTLDIDTKMSDSVPLSEKSDYFPVVDFNPVEIYLKELRKNYSEWVMCFYNTYGGSVIGVLIKPGAMEHVKFNVNNVNCKTSNPDGTLQLNFAAMVHDFHRLGEGIVKNIIIKSEKFQNLM